MNVTIEIERLVLDGLDLPRAQHAALRAAVEQELARLLVVDGMSPSLGGGGAMPSVRVAPMTVPAGATPRQLGDGIARSVYGALGK